MARILAAQEQPFSPVKRGMSPARESLFASAREDARKTLDILENVGITLETQKTKTEVLRTALAEITW
jgi:hypothetical protein